MCSRICLFYFSFSFLWLLGLFTVCFSVSIALSLLLSGCFPVLLFLFVLLHSSVSLPYLSFSILTFLFHSFISSPPSNIYTLCLCLSYPSVLVFLPLFPYMILSSFLYHSFSISYHLFYWVALLMCLSLLSISLSLCAFHLFLFVSCP